MSLSLLSRRSLWLPLATASLALLASPTPAHATPSTVYWAPSTPAVQGAGVLHLTYDTYFASSGLYPVDVGATIGVLPWQGLQLELGADLLYPTSDGEDGLSVPVYFNGKLGAPQDVYFPGQPAWSAGIYNVGLESDVTDYDVVYGVLGYTFERLGSVAAGGYYGMSDTLLVDRDGEEARAGVLASYTSPAIHVPLLDKLVVAADLQTGQNALGAGGAGLALYFTPAVALVTGPVFFLEPEVQPGASDWMWTAQIDVDLDLTSTTP